MGKLEYSLLLVCAISSLGVFVVDMNGYIQKKLEGHPRSERARIFSEEIYEKPGLEAAAFAFSLSVELVLGLAIAFLGEPYFVISSILRGVGNQTLAYVALAVWITWLLWFLEPIRRMHKELIDNIGRYPVDKHRAIRKLYFFIPSAYLWYLLAISQGLR